MYCLDMANRAHGVERYNHHWKDQKNTIHVDESWFLLKKGCSRVRVMPSTTIPPPDTCQHKSHIVKVMFLMAMGRPQMRPDGTWFDGKIGCWPCIKRVPAVNNDGGFW